MTQTITLADTSFDRLANYLRWLAYEPDDAAENGLFDRGGDRAWDYSQALGAPITTAPGWNFPADAYASDFDLHDDGTITANVYESTAPKQGAAHDPDEELPTIRIVRETPAPPTRVQAIEAALTKAVRLLGNARGFKDAEVSELANVLNAR